MCILISRSSDKRQAKAERDILHAMAHTSPHPFTAGLKFAFQSANNLYLGKCIFNSIKVILTKFINNFIDLFNGYSIARNGLLSWWEFKTAYSKVWSFARGVGADVFRRACISYFPSTFVARAIQVYYLIMVAL